MKNKDFMENLTALETLIGLENVENVKKSIGDLIVNKVYKDIDDWECYLFYPPDYEESIKDAFEMVKKKITKMYADGFLEVAEKAVEEFKNKNIKHSQLVDEDIIPLYDKIKNTKLTEDEIVSFIKLLQRKRDDLQIYS